MDPKTEGTTPPRVAVIVRTKDRPRYLRRAVQSIAAQTMPDWECVIVNDGGDPQAVQRTLDELPAPVHERVRVVEHAASAGRWVSANAGVLASSAPLLVLHDDDDSWDPTFLERACEYLDAPEHAERDGVVSRIEIIWERQAGDTFEETGREMFQGHLAAPTLSASLLFNRFVPIGFVYRRDLHAELGLYEDRLPVVGDWNFNLKVLARGPLEYLEGAPLAFWHQRPDQEGADANSVVGAQHDHHATDAMLRDEALREYVAEHGLGLPLYLTKFIDQRFVDVENGIRRHLSEVEDATNRRLDELQAALVARSQEAERTVRGDIRWFSFPDRVLRAIVRALRRR